jgi:hypothetical protein
MRQLIRGASSWSLTRSEKVRSGAILTLPKLRRCAGERLTARGESNAAMQSAPESGSVINKEEGMSSVESARLYINGSDDGQLPITIPEHDLSAPISADTGIRATVTLSQDDINKIEEGTYYDLRIRLWEEDNSLWPWGDDDDEQMWQRRPRLKGLPSETVEVSVDVPVLTLKDHEAEYSARVKLYRRTNSGMTGLASKRTNTINLDYSDSLVT